MTDKTEYIYKARIVSAYDGDTVRADIDLGMEITHVNQILRLYGINAPEMRGDEREAGILARDFLRNAILDKEVILHTHRDKKGKYGRWLATIWLNGVSVNDLMVGTGHAVFRDY